MSRKEEELYLEEIPAKLNQSNLPPKHLSA